MSSSWIRVALNPMTRVLVRHRRGATAQVPGDGAGRDRDAWETAAEERTDPCRPPLVSQSPGRPPGARNAAEPTVPLAAGSSALLRSDKKPEFTRSSSGGSESRPDPPTRGLGGAPARQTQPGVHHPTHSVHQAQTAMGTQTGLGSVELLPTPQRPRPSRSGQAALTPHACSRPQGASGKRKGPAAQQVHLMSP